MDNKYDEQAFRERLKNTSLKYGRTQELGRPVAVRNAYTDRWSSSGIRYRNVVAIVRKTRPQRITAPSPCPWNSSKTYYSCRTGQHNFASTPAGPLLPVIRARDDPTLGSIILHGNANSECSRSGTLGDVQSTLSLNSASLSVRRIIACSAWQAVQPERETSYGHDHLAVGVPLEIHRSTPLACGRRRVK